MAEPDWRPSVKLRDLLSGKTPWDDADDAIRSMARLPIHQAALTICMAETQGARIAMLGKIPATVRPHVQAEVSRLWPDRKRLKAK